MSLRLVHPMCDQGGNASCSASSLSRCKTMHLFCRFTRTLRRTKYCTIGVEDDLEMSTTNNHLSTMCCSANQFHHHRTTSVPHPDLTQILSCPSSVSSSAHCGDLYSVQLGRRLQQPAHNQLGAAAFIPLLASPL